MKLKFYISFLFVLSVNYSFSQSLTKQNHDLNVALQNFISDNDFKNAGIGFYVTDIKSGEILSQLNPYLSLSPASTQKLITTAVALELLGHDYRFETKLEFVGEIDEQTQILNGDIIIRGGGDPTLGSRYFDDNPELFLNRWAESLAKKNIRYINGKIIGDARIYDYEIVPPTWSWEDMGNYFGAGACGLSIYDNLYTIYYNTGKLPGEKTEITKIEPEIEGLSVDNHVISDRVYSDKSYIFGAPYTYHRYITGELPLNKTDYKIKGSMPDPAYFTACEFKRILKEHNISSEQATTFRLQPELSKIDSEEHFLIDVIQSPVLEKIIQQTNFKSINLFAEHLYKHSQLIDCRFDLLKKDKNFIENFWRNKGIDTEGMFIYDGSGLSNYNAVTAKQMVDILVFMKNKSRYFNSFYASIPVAGKEGTVKSLCKGTSAENNMHVKSGSIKNVRAYAGYVKTVSGRELAFSLIINNYNGSSSETKSKMEKLLSAIADFNL